MSLKSPNYTQVPNELFDEWMLKLTPAEFKIIMKICRNTFGWQKEKDQISISQINKYTGLSRVSICSGIKKLEEYDLIECHRSNNKTTCYRVRVDATSKLSLPVDGNLVNSVYHTSKLSLPDDAKTSKLSLHTKESNINKVLNKNNTSDNSNKEFYNAVLKSFHFGHNELTGTENLGDYKIQGRHIKTIIDRCAKESNGDIQQAMDMCGRMVQCFYELIKSGSDKFWSSQPFIPSALASNGIWDRVRDNVLKSRKKSNFLKVDSEGRHFNIFTKRWEK